MSAFKGNMMLLKIGDGNTPEQFRTVGGLRVSRLMLNRQLVETTALREDAWRTLLPEAGKAFLRLQGDGIYADSSAERQLRGMAFSGSAAMCRLYSGEGGCVQARCVVAGYEREGKVAELATFRVTLESVETVSYLEA